MDNVIKAYFYSGNIARTNTVFQYNRGMILKFMDVDLPATYRVDFANSLTGQSVTCVGTADGVIVPLEVMAKGCTVYAWAVIANEDSTVTEYQAMIPISPRAEPTDEAPNPEQQQVIDQLIAAMNQAVEQTGADVESADTAAAAAAASAQAAAASEAAASASEQAAAASEQAAAGSASSASADAATAASAASTATQQAGIATSGAGTATQKAADAAASAQDAASSETAAAGSAAAAATSETNAETAETATQTAQAAAEAAAQSVSESAAQIETNKEDIADLKSAITDITGNQIIDFSDPALKQYIATNGSTVQWDTPSTSQSTTIKWAAVPCIPGDKFTISGKGGSADRLWAFADAQKNLLDPRASTGATANKLVLTAPESAAYLILNSETDVMSYKGELFCDDVENKIAKKYDTNDSPYDFALTGNGSSVVQQDFKIVNGHKYKLQVIDPGEYNGSSSDIRLQISTFPSGSARIRFTSADPSGEFVFDADSTDARIYIRANAGVKTAYRLYDVTENCMIGIGYYANGFGAENGDGECTVSWSNLNVITNRGVYDLDESASYTLSNSYPLLILKNSDVLPVRRLVTYNALSIDDIVLLSYRNGISGGLLYPLYERTVEATPDTRTGLACFTTGFNVQETTSGCTVSWTRLYVSTTTEAYDSSASVSFAMSNARPLLILSNSTVKILTSYGSLQNTDIILLNYRDGLVGGLLYPTYVNSKSKYVYNNDAELNTRKQVHQLADLKWTPLDDLRAGEGIIPEGVEFTGVPYSSVKEYLKYVGIDVSIHTFMTAVHNAKSLLYTECPMGTASESAYGITYHGVNSYCYYGSVCSGLVTTAIGSDIQFNSWEYQTFPDFFMILDDQNVRGCKVGDVFSYNGHCMVLTGVERDENGSMIGYEISEHSSPINIGHRYNFNEDRPLAELGKWCRYKLLSNNIHYKPSPFVLGDDEYMYYKYDLVYKDGDSSRTYYSCKTNNRDANWTASHWDTIPAFAANTLYKPRPETLVSDGDHIYRCIKEHTSGSTLNPAYWEEIKRVYEWEPYPYVYNDDIVTFAGDRAAFHTSDLIYINYAKGNYTYMQIYKDGTLYQTIELPTSGDQINVSSYCSGAGMYKARLTGGENYSRYTYFEVIDTQVTASYSNGIAEITFSSSNGTPVEAQIVEQSGATICHYPFTGDDLAKGSVKINPCAKMYAEKHMYPNRYTEYSETGYARVMFSGEYGNVVNAMISLGTVVPITGNLIESDVLSDCGEFNTNKTVILSGQTIGKRYVFRFKAATGASVDVIPCVGDILWISGIPAELTNGTTYLVTVDNGIGNVLTAT